VFGIHEGRADEGSGRDIQEAIFLLPRDAIRTWPVSPRLVRAPQRLSEGPWKQWWLPGAPQDAARRSQGILVCLASLSEVADYANLARLAYVSRTRISQIMNLLLLASDIQEEILIPAAHGWRAGCSPSAARPADLCCP